MTHHQFFKFLQKWREIRKYPNSGVWPDQIDLGKDFWSGVKEIANFTKRDNYEYATSFFFVDGDIVNSPPLKGGKHSIKVKHSLNVKYEPANHSYYYKKIIIDRRIVKQKSVKLDKLPKQIDAGFLLNIHTHPVYYLNKRTGEIISFDEYRKENRKQGLKYGFLEFLGLYKVTADNNPDLLKTYGFFSDTDLNTFLNSKVLITGLVTDQFWLACKTDKIISQIGPNGINMLNGISKLTYSGEQYIEGLIREQMRDWGMVFYRAKIGSSLKRI